MKKIFSLLLTVVLLLGMIPIPSHAAQGGKLIALTFDDGPDGVDTVKLLDGLETRQAKVTFFTLGQNASRNKDLIRRAYAQGHEIACHSWDHPDLTGKSDAEVRRQVKDSTAVLDEICGTGANYLFRPPFGSTNERVRSLIPHPIIIWSVDPQDWKYRNTDTVRNHIVNNAYDGAIVLVHDIHSTTIPAALQAIDILTKQGYEFVTVSELYRRRGLSMQPGVRYFDCRSNGTDLGPIEKPEISYTVSGDKMEITLTAPSDAPIYYTLDGSVPNQQATRYEGPFEAPYPCNLHAVAAYQLNGSRSEPAVLAPGETPCQMPRISVENGIVTMQAEDPGVTIYYTLDGSDPASGGRVYEAPIPLSGEGELRVICGGGFYRPSPEQRLYYSARGQLYRDIRPGDWYFDPMDRMTAEGMMKGVGDYRVAPQERLTRGMLVTLLYRYQAAPLEEGWEKTSQFGDVPGDEYYAAPVEWAFRNGIVNGDSATVFRPEGDITRQELCRVIAGFLKHRGHTLPAGTALEGRFDDAGRISDWAKESMESMVAAQLLLGDGRNVNPRGSATRAEVSAILIRMMDYEAGLEAEAVPPAEETAPMPQTPTAPAA